MVIYQSKTSKTKSNFVECTVPAMFGCGIGETILHASQGGEIYD